MTEIITAAMIVIGDEILSGRTKDRNIGQLADVIPAIGMGLMAVRLVADDEADIVEEVIALRQRYTYVFTIGGIGRSHEDITAHSIARGFGVPCEYDERASGLLGAHHALRAVEFAE